MSDALPPHILIVDDDERIRDLLQKYLQKSGFLVSKARDTVQAERLLAGLDFDLIVLDVMMPGEDGISFTRRLRDNFLTPIMLLTARGDTGNRISGLEAGADDYMAKPFEPRELLLRLNAILRRMPAPSLSNEEAGAELRLGIMRYDINRGELWRGTERISLTGTEQQLMRIFSQWPGEALSRERLVHELGRAGGQAQERAVDVQITRLRRKLEDDPKAPRFLQTIRGEGYLLAPE